MSRRVTSGLFTGYLFDRWLAAVERFGFLMDLEELRMNTADLMEKYRVGA